MDMTARDFLNGRSSWGFIRVAENSNKEFGFDIVLVLDGHYFDRETAESMRGYFQRMYDQMSEFEELTDRPEAGDPRGYRYD